VDTAEIFISAARTFGKTKALFKKEYPNYDPNYEHAVAASDLLKSPESAVGYIFFCVPNSMMELCLDYLCVKEYLTVFCLNTSWCRVFLLQRSIQFFRDQIYKNISAKKRDFHSVSISLDYKLIKLVPYKSLPNLPDYFLMPRTTMRLFLTIVDMCQENARRGSCNIEGDSEDDSEDNISGNSESGRSFSGPPLRRKPLSLNCLNRMEGSDSQTIITKRIHDIVGDTATNTFVGPKRLVNGTRFIVLLMIVLLPDLLYY
jgi:hypothetical protein